MISRSRRLHFLFGSVFVVGIFLATTAYAQKVEITSPADNSTFTPGQTITIVTKGTPAVQTALITVEKPLPQAREIAPMKFTLELPDDIPEGTYHIRAMAQSNGQFVQSEPLNLNIGWPGNLVKAEPYPAEINFDAIGENKALQILGTFDNGREADISHSGKSAYITTNPNVATVSLTGVVTSLGLGDAKIVFRNSGVLCVVNVKVEPINKGGISYNIHMVADSPLKRGNDDTNYYVAHVTTTNNSTIPLAYIKITEAWLNDQPAHALPEKKLNFITGEDWKYKLSFGADAGLRGSKAKLHVKGVYSAVAEFYHREKPFEAEYAVQLP